MSVTVARFSSDGVAIRYVLLVLWMTSYFHTMEPVGQNQAQTLNNYVLEIHQVAVPVGHQITTVFDRVHQNVSRGRSLLSTIALFELYLIVVSSTRAQASWVPA